VRDVLPITEKQFTAQLKDLAETLGWMFYHPFLSVHSARGYPDCTLVRPPRLILCELKTNKGQPTAAQHEWLEALQACLGVECYLWRPSDMDDIVEILRGDG
jgi:hypothetical protein